MKCGKTSKPCERRGERFEQAFRGARRPSLTASHGFSLMEMLVALTLIAMMAVGMWGVFRISVASWSRGTEFIDNNQRHRSILDLVRKQMASIYGLVAPVDMESGGTIYPIFAGAENSVQFISLVSFRFQDNPGLTMVSYELVQDRRGSYALVEREEQYLGSGPAEESIFDRREQTVIKIFDNLESFMFEYFEPGSKDRPSRWVKEWNARETRRLPAAISMTMTAQDPEGRMLNRQVIIPIAAKPHDPRLNFVNPFESRPGRLSERIESEAR